MAKIQVLDSATIDQIAAGEVVERPASVVKEAVENAIDAGADAVTVEIKEGGISLIRVTDNGSGIEKSEIANAFKRHATSKIRTAADLLGVTSLGFRGEALSSISAVAQVELITKTKEELAGSRYTIAGGREGELEEVGAPEGTTLLIRNLFYNTPPRRKFLKTAATEGSYISDLMEHMALSRPDVSFQFIQNGQTRFYTSGGGDLKEVIYRIYGRDITRELLPVRDFMEGIAVSGFLGKPSINRANRNFETYFVNGRYIKSSLVAKGIEEGYKAYLMQHKYPFTVLHFTIDSELLDVNVHPNKMDIRFQNQMAFYDFLVRTVSDTLKQRELIPSVPVGKTEKSDKQDQLAKKETTAKAPEPFEKNRLAEQRVAEESEYHTSVPADGQNQYEGNEQNKDSRPDGTGTFLSKQSGTEQILPEQRPQGTKALKKLAENLEQAEIVYQAETHEQAETVHPTESFRRNDIFELDENPKIIGSPPQKDALGNAIIKKSNQVFVEKPEQLTMFEDTMLVGASRSDYRIIGQLFQTYWLIEYEEKLFIMDQHAAHEKVKYERLMQRFKEQEPVSQNLNPPVIIQFSGREEALFQEYKDAFSSLGFEVEAFGGSSYAIRSVPAVLYGNNEKQMFLDIMDELGDTGIKGAPEAVCQKLASMACKAAVKGNMRMSMQEAESLLQELFGLENPYHCPHGRPTMISMSKYEIEKKFKRVL